MTKKDIAVRTKKIVVLPGDGIGPEIVQEAVKVLETVKERFALDISFEERLVGGAAYDACGKCLPEETLEACKAADAVLLGAVGGPKWDSLPGAERPERALLGLRGGLGLFANLRPAKIWPVLSGASPLKCEGGIDLLVVRELTGGVYFGEHSRSADGASARDVMEYSIAEVERIARVAFECARRRRSKVTSVDKTNVLETSRLWREIAGRIAKEYPDITVEEYYIDIMTANLVTDRVRNKFQVILLPNLYGDIITDEAAQLQGGVGTAGSANLGDKYAMFEAIHGSAPRMIETGRGCYANPTSMIKASEMLLRHIGYVEKADKLNEALHICTEVEKKVIITGHADGATGKEFSDYLMSVLEGLK